MKKAFSNSPFIVWCMAVILLLVLLCPIPLVGQEKVEKERTEFKALIGMNRNYFGTYPELKIKPVFPLQYKTKYEELTCVGYFPDSDRLEAVIQVKLENGYGGSLCTNGSHEYVRFYVDWNGDGDYTDSGEDEGLAQVNVHNIPNIVTDRRACLSKTKPLFYAVHVQPHPRKKQCRIPYIVKMKAVLSWEAPPPAGNPNAPVVWGNFIEKWIQVDPLPHLMLSEEITPEINFDEIKKESQITPKKVLPVSELQKMYEGKNVPEKRFRFTELHSAIEKIQTDPTSKQAILQLPEYMGKGKLIEELLASQNNTRYEELRCLGLNYDLDQLVATLTVKLAYGYSGNLCTAGSKEYVAFWAYVWNPATFSCKWRYLGTGSVSVYDISAIPNEGLQYSLYLPVDLSEFKGACNKPKILRIRGVLSWNSPPSVVDPFKAPHWGNASEIQIQVKPGLQVPQNQQLPFLWSAGTMAVESIAGNPFSLTSPGSPDGYAYGISLNGGFTAVESPFGGKIAISGTITHTQNLAWKYKVQYRKGGSGWIDIGNPFRIWIRKNGVPSGYIDQVATNGYYTYRKDLDAPDTVEVEGDYMAHWPTPVLFGDGLYDVRILLLKSGAPASGDVPADHIASNPVKLMIDNQKPVADVSLDGGNCNTTFLGDSITGKFTATDKHISFYYLNILPVSAPLPPIFTSIFREQYPNELLGYPALPAANLLGRINEAFSLSSTATTTPCGYVIGIHVWDRAIINNSRYGNYNTWSVGFCLLKK
jgi:hypothetical protein